MSRKKGLFESQENIPKPWKKYKSNKGNWYYYNPETNVSVWNLSEYLNKTESEAIPLDESQYSVSRNNDQEIVISSSFTTYYDEMFNDDDDDDDDDDDYSSSSKAVATNPMPTPASVQTPISQPTKAITAISAKRFSSKPSQSSLVPCTGDNSVRSNNIHSDMKVTTSKKIVSLKPELPVIASSKDPIEVKAKVASTPDPLESLEIRSLLKLSANSLSIDKKDTLSIAKPSLAIIDEIRSIKRIKSTNFLNYLSIANSTEQQDLSPLSLYNSYLYLRFFLY